MQNAECKMQNWGTPHPSSAGQTQVCVFSEAILLKQNHEAWACPHEAFAPQK